MKKLVCNEGSKQVNCSTLVSGQVCIDSCMYDKSEEKLSVLLFMFNIIVLGGLSSYLNHLIA